MTPDFELRVVLVDDEPPALDRLRGAVASEPGFLVVGEARDGIAAYDLIVNARPDIAIIDIEMPGMNGLELVRQIDPRTMPAVIFATAFDQHALQAFDVGAADFILKPIDYGRMRTALMRARAICAGDRRAEVTSALLRQVEALRIQLGEGEIAYRREIWVQKRSEFRRIDIADIDWLQSERDFVRIHAQGESYLLRETLSGLEARLDPANFLRVHRSYLINIAKPLTLHRTLRGGLAVHTAAGSLLPVGRSYVRQLRERLELPRT